MNAPTKIEAPTANTAIWQAVSKTDPAHTKKVNQRGGFTAISAHYQVMRATEQFGPVGIGWGYSNGAPIFEDGLCIIPVTLWHGDRSNSYGPIYGSAEMRDQRGRLDADAPKKAATDGLTKALSHLGFNADVFLGRFDDNKYVQQVAAEFAEGHSQNGAVSPPQPRKQLDGPYKSATALQTAIKGFVHELEGVGDYDELRAFLDTKDSVALIEQIKRDKPDWWNGWPEQPDEFIPLHRKIEMREAELAQQIADIARA